MRRGRLNQESVVVAMSKEDHAMIIEAIEEDTSMSKSEQRRLKRAMRPYTVLNCVSDLHLDGTRKVPRRVLHLSAKGHRARD